MDKVDRETLWARRPNSSKLSLSTSQAEHSESKAEHSSRSFSSSKRWGGDTSSNGRSNPFNALSPVATTGISSPSSAATSAFGLGSGAFASFGSSAKTPRTPGTAFDFGKAAGAGSTPSTPIDKQEKVTSRAQPTFSKATPTATSDTTTTSNGPSTESGTPWSLKYTWVIWYRPPTSKNSDYEKSTKPMCKMATAQQFWKVYAHLKRPSQLPAVSDYHFFRDGIRPVWEDEENKRGGKWIMRLKKGVADRYWEELLMAMIGDQFLDVSEEVCGAVLSVRSGEDVFSIWVKNDGGRNVKIRETIKRVLSLPPDTQMIWKSHDDSIAQRTLIDQARHDKTTHHTDSKRRVTLTSEPAEASTPLKDRTNAA